jgi:flagellar basal-body rod modification protein FlgD
MTIYSATDIPATVAGMTTTPKAHKTALDSLDFMTLIMEELKNQNPLEPMDSKDSMAQMAQMNSLQELQKLNATLTQFTSSSSVTAAAGLIGRKIEANLDDGTAINGIVTSVTLEGNDVMLMVGDKQVPPSAVFKISAQETTSNA